MNNRMILEEIMKGLEMGISSIEAVKTHIEKQTMQVVVQEQQKDYQQLLAEAKALSQGMSEKDNRPGKAIETAFLKSMIKMKTMINDSDAHIASMLIQGGNMLVIDLNRIRNEYVNEARIRAFIDQLLETETRHIDALKPFL